MLLQKFSWKRVIFWGTGIALLFGSLAIGGISLWVRQRESVAIERLNSVDLRVFAEVSSAKREVISGWRTENGNAVEGICSCP